VSGLTWRVRVPGQRLFAAFSVREPWDLEDVLAKFGNPTKPAPKDFPKSVRVHSHTMASRTNPKSLHSQPTSRRYSQVRGATLASSEIDRIHEERFGFGLRCDLILRKVCPSASPHRA
jgi:hypothetical protein